MKYQSYAVALFCSLLFVSTSFAKVTFIAPKTVKILAVNGEKSSANQRANLPDGLSQVVFRVDAEIPGKSFKDDKIAKSEVMILRFEAVNESVTLEIPKIKTIYNFEKFNKDPEIQLISSKGDSVPFAFDRLRKKGFQLMRDYEVELAAYNKTKAPAAVSVAEVAGASITTKSAQQNLSWSATAQSQPASDQSVAGEMLKYWYQQADDETRQKFWDWISE